MPDDFGLDPHAAPGREPDDLAAPGLAPGDAEALDALAEAGFDPAGVPAHLRGRATALAALLTLLDVPGPTEAGAAAARAQATVAHIQALTHGGEAPDPELTPSAEDAVDAYVMAAGEVGRVPGALRPRAATLHGWSLALRTLDANGEAWVTAARAGRIDAACSAVAASGEPLSIMQAKGPRVRFHWRDLVSIAAVLLLVSAVAMPVVGSVQRRQRQLACASHLDQSFQGFGTYAGDYQDVLPTLTAGLADSWIRVGEDPRRSNSANLFTLVRTMHASQESLSCPGNPDAPTGAIEPGAMDWKSLDRISFSYQIDPGTRARYLLPGDAVILVDRSPVIPRAVRGEAFRSMANSPNHGETGQHVMRLDGSVTWMTSPVLVGGDNVYLPRSVEMVLARVKSAAGLMDGDEWPESPADAFVAP